MLYKVCEIHTPEHAFTKDKPLFSRSLFVWENSFGNIQYPDKSSFPDDLPSAQFYLIFFVWTLNQFIVVVILLNFLIAVISQSYENVMNSKEIKL